MAKQLMHEGTLTDAVALAALEVARHLPRSSGWLRVEQALACLEKRGQAKQGAAGQTAQAERTMSGAPGAAATATCGGRAEAERRMLGDALGDGEVDGILQRVLFEGKIGRRQATTAPAPAPAAAAAACRTPGVHPA